MPFLEAMDTRRWSPERARHLLQRAGFGISPARVAELAAMTPEQAVDRMIAGWPGTAQAQRPDFLIHPEEHALTRQRMAAAEPGERALINQAHQRREREALERLKGWWLERMWASPHPLQEKMALFWHGHFATSAQKVRFSWHNWDLNQLFREQGLGPIPALTIAVGQSPVMLDYLDNRMSTREAPNENWARELLELFTLGQGAYTEKDIQEAARAFTGWTTDRYAFQYRLERHDHGEKSFLGQSGHLDGWDIIRIVFEQPAAAPFLAGKLWHFFAGDAWDEEAVQGLAQCLRDHEYQVAPALKALFLSEAFYGEAVMGTQVKSPVQFVLQLCADLELEAMPWFDLGRACRALGQDLFYPPNVKGWEGNRSWINANSLLLRYNLPPLLVQAAMRPDRRGAGARGMMEMAPAGAPSMAEAEAVPRAERIREALQARPREERRALRQALQTGPGPERSKALEALGLPDDAQAVPIGVFEHFAFNTAGECVAALSARFFSRPLAPEQTGLLLAALGTDDPDQPLRRDTLDNDRRFRVLRLLTSMAEYQLC